MDNYKVDDAEIAIVVVGSTAGTLKVIVDQLRQEGIKAGVLRLRTFRPFPVEQLRSLKNVKTVAVMDKAMSFGAFGGAVFNEVRNALYDAKEHPTIVNYIFGLAEETQTRVSCEKFTMTLCRLTKQEPSRIKCVTWG